MLDNFISEPFLGFDKESIDFLGKLKNKRYNNKVWFDKNRNIYEDFLKIPMRSLLDNLNSEILKFEPRIVITSKSVFRINRDIRFKKDKTPYKFNYSAAFTYDVIKKPEIPQFYFHLSPDEFLFAAGQYSSDSTVIKSIRNRICKDEEYFFDIINDNTFKKTFSTINGNRLVKVPSEFKSNKYSDDINPFLKMKQFYVFKTYPPEIALSNELTELIIKNVRITNNFNKFLYDSIK